MIRLMLKTLLGLAIIMLTETFLFAGMACATSQPVDNTTLIVQENEELKYKIVELENKISNLETRLSISESKSNSMQTGAVSVLFGAFCALWAQNTRRNAFGWFILGVIGSIFTVLAVLWNNHYDITHPPSESD